MQNPALPLRTAGYPYFEEAEKVLICKKAFAQPMVEQSFLDRALIEKWYEEKGLSYPVHWAGGKGYVSPKISTIKSADFSAFFV